MSAATESRTIKFLRAVIAASLAIVLVILVSGGGRWFGVDFRSIGAWVLPALLISLFFTFRKIPIFRPADVARFRRLNPSVVILGFFTVVAVTGVLKVLTFHTHLFDAGFLFQAITHGFGNPVLQCDLCTNDSYLGEHQSLALLFLTPLATLISSPLFFPVALALTGMAIHLTVQGHFKRTLSRMELLFLFLCLVSVRGFREGFLFDFREDALGALFFVGGLALYLRKRFIFGGALFILAAFTKETAIILLPFTFFALGVHQRNIGTKRERWIRHASELLISAGFFLFTFYYMMPLWRSVDATPSNLAIRLAFLGSTPHEIFSSLVFHPFASGWKILTDVLRMENIRYFVFNVGPFLPFLIFAWNPLYLPGLVLLAGNLMSTVGTQKLMQFHYELMVLPFFAMGLGTSLETLKRRGVLTSDRLAPAAMVFLAVSGIWPMSHLSGFLSDRDRIASYFWVREELKGLSRKVVLAEGLIYPAVSTHSRLRPLLTPVLDPAKRAHAGNALVGDATHAFLFGPDALIRLSPAWTLERCDKREWICLYARSSTGKETL